MGKFTFTSAPVVQEKKQQPKPAFTLSSTAQTTTQKPAQKPQEQKPQVDANKDKQQPQQQQPKEQQQEQQKKKVTETKEQRIERLERWKKEEDEQRAERASIEQPTNKPLSVIFSGHVDHGKSSTVGHLLVNMNKVDERTIQKFKQEASKTVGESWAYAFALDACEEEREKGKTVESARASFTTPKGRRVVVLDSPGHKGFIGSMIESAAQADCAVLVTSARKGEYEAGLERSGQTAEHAQILYVSGVKQVIVAVNKMDDPTVNYNKERYDQVCQGINKYLTKSVGFSQKNITYIPISALQGENLTSKLPTDSKMNWYQGPCLIDLIDSVKIPKRDIGGFTRAVVSGKYKEQNYFAVSKVEKGIVSVGDTVKLMPANIDTKVITIESEEGGQLQKAFAGENCRIAVNEQVFNNIQDGSILCDPKHPCQVSNAFAAKIFILNCENIISAGFRCIVHINCSTVEAEVTKVYGLISKETGKLDKQRQQFVKAGQTALVEFKCENDICINKFEDESFLGRVLVRWEQLTVAVGQVVKVSYE